jgi:hypothetical protein
MLIYFNDAVSKQHVAINPKYVIAVFPVVEGDLKGKIAISLINGSVVVEESQTEVVGRVQSEI